MGQLFQSLLKPRPLPAAAVLAVVLLIFKLAAMIAEPRETPAAPLALISPAAAAGGNPAPAGKAAKGEGPVTGSAPASAAKPAPAQVNNDGKAEKPGFTASEIEVLQQLRQRREALDAREQELVRREDMMRAAAERIDQRVGELTAVRADIERLIKAQDTQNEHKLLSLVRIYENMKPAEAARIFEEVDMHTLLSVVERMKERKLAPILAEMKPAKARDITVELARLKALIGAHGAANRGETGGEPPAAGTGATMPAPASASRS